VGGEGGEGGFIVGRAGCKPDVLSVYAGSIEGRGEGEGEGEGEGREERAGP